MIPLIDGYIENNSGDNENTSHCARLYKSFLYNNFFEPLQKPLIVSENDVVFSRDLQTVPMIPWPDGTNLYRTCEIKE